MYEGIKTGAYVDYEQQIKTVDMLKAIKHKPLFGDRRSKTRWLCFMKGAELCRN